MKIGIEILRRPADGEPHERADVVELQHGDRVVLHVERRVDAEGLAGPVNQLAHAIGGSADIVVHEEAPVGKSPAEIERDRIAEMERDRAQRREAEDVAEKQAAAERETAAGDEAAKGKPDR